MGLANITDLPCIACSGCIRRQCRQHLNQKDAPAVGGPGEIGAAARFGGDDCAWLLLTDEALADGILPEPSDSDV